MRTYLAIFLFITFYSFVYIATEKRVHPSSQIINTCDSIPLASPKLIDITRRSDWISSLKRTPDNGYIIAGAHGNFDVAREGLLAKLDENANLEWAKIIGQNAFVDPNNPFATHDIEEYFMDIIVLPDSGYIAICPKRNSSFFDVDAPFLIRLDQAGNVVWSKELLFDGSVEGYIWQGQLLSNGNILVSGSTDAFSIFQFIIEIDLEGNIVKSKTLNSLGRLYLNSQLYENTNNTYQMFASNRKASNTENQFEIVTFSINASTFEINTAPQKIALDTMIYEKRGLEDSPNWAKVADGFLLGTNIRSFDNTNEACIIKVDNNYNYEWAKSYQDTTLQFTDIANFIKVNGDGKIWVTFERYYTYTFMTQNSYSSNQNISLAEIDNNGAIIWNEFIGTDNAEAHTQFVFDENEQATLITSSRSSQGFSRGLHLYQIDSSGFFGNCNQENLNIIAEDVTMVQSDFSIQTSPFTGQLVDFDIPVVDAKEVITKDLCCNDKADADFRLVQLNFVCPDSLKTTIEVCNTGDVNFPDSLTISIYDDYPSSQEVDEIYTVFLTNLPDNNNCQYYEVNIPNIEAEMIYLIANPPQGLLPFNTPCDFVFADFEECDFRNNIDSIAIDESYNTEFGLGNDTLICKESLFYLSPGNHLTDFLWQDGSTDSLFQVVVPGIYWIEAVDRSGLIYRDTIEIGEVEVPSFDFGIDTLFHCYDDSLSTYLEIPNIFDSYYWDDDWGGPSLFTCDTCPQTYSTMLSSPQRVVGIGYSIEGCESRDTIQLIPYDFVLPTQTDTFTCPNQPILLGSVLYPADSTPVVTLQTTNGCDSLVTYHIATVDTSLAYIQTSACVGDTLFFDDTPVPAGATTQLHYTNVKGCDSILVVQVEALLPAFSNETIAVCAGESALIFGNIETQAGIYTRNYTAANGCDSIHQITLEIYEDFAFDLITQPTCESENNGRASISIANGLPPFSYDWGSINSTSMVAEGLAFGDYQVIITDSAGCSQTIDFSIPFYAEDVAAFHCEPQVFAPNVFSPNDDSINDFFYLQSNERVVAILSLNIFDRYGELVFENKDILPNEENAGWNGVFNGELMNPQVFIWQAEVQFLSGEQKVFYGDVVLLR